MARSDTDRIGGNGLLPANGSISFGFITGSAQTASPARPPFDRPSRRSMAAYLR